jgi:hypothetical protein
MKKKLSDDHAEDVINNFLNNQKAIFFQSVLKKLHESDVDVFMLASFIQKGWEQGYYNSTWMSLLSEYNTLEGEVIWRRAFRFGSDKLIIEAWIKYEKPAQLTIEQEELLRSAISRFGALAQIKQARNDRSGGDSEYVEHLLGPLLDGSDLIFNGNNK